MSNHGVELQEQLGGVVSHGGDMLEAERVAKILNNRGIIVVYVRYPNDSTPTSVRLPGREKQSRPVDLGADAINAYFGQAS
ncbi:MAG: hypothetical protein ACYCPS_02015 [Candidatus Saccharimonadales bacterium]